MKVALDTNILAYAEGVNGVTKKKAAIDLLQRLPQSGVVIPVQALGELFHVLMRKAGRSGSKARAAILEWQDTFVCLETSRHVLQSAIDLAADHQLSIWDAVILSAASEADCRLLLSEDLQDGFTWSGVTVTNPFADPTQPLLEALLSSRSES